MTDKERAIQEAVRELASQARTSGKSGLEATIDRRNEIAKLAQQVQIPLSAICHRIARPGALEETQAIAGDLMARVKGKDPLNSIVALSSVLLPLLHQLVTAADRAVEMMADFER